MEEEIVEINDNHCLYCGKSMSERYDDYQLYYECDCEDAVRNREIDEEIRKLDYSRPLKKFRVKRYDLVERIKYS